MKGYTETVVFTAQQKEDMAFAIKLIECLPARDEAGDWIRCHELARVIGGPLLSNRWFVVDGHLGTVEHTWLVWRGKGHIILDLYVPGALPQVQLIDCNPLWRRGDYRPGGARRDVREKIIEWLAVELLKVEVAGATKQPEATP